MKLLRLTLACSLLLLAAAPTFAVACKSCDGPSSCIFTPDSGTKCQRGIDWCNTIDNFTCVGFTDEAAAPAMLAEWTVATIEISRPAEGTKVVTAPAAVADANVSRDTLRQ